jgi:hypothetical protein
MYGNISCNLLERKFNKYPKKCPKEGGGAQIGGKKKK